MYRLWVWEPFGRERVARKPWDVTARRQESARGQTGRETGRRTFQPLPGTFSNRFGVYNVAGAGGGSEGPREKKVDESI